MNDFNVYLWLIGQQDHVHFCKLSSKDQCPYLCSNELYDLDFNAVIIRVAIAADQLISPAHTVKRLV
jgi:hypothetical protein